MERITAAINALLRPHLKPEKFIEIPENPEQMTRGDLDTLVRPLADGFLRSQPTKEEPLSQLRQIARRQASRPSWMPRTEDSASVVDGEETSDESSQLVPMRLSGFPELGEVTINAPAFYGDPMYSADSNQPALLQMALLTVFGAAVPDATGRTVRGDGTALDALRVIRNSPAQAFADLHLIVSKLLISARRAKKATTPRIGRKEVRTKAFYRWRVSIRKSGDGSLASTGACAATRWRGVRDLRLVRVFAVLRGGRGGF